MIKPPVNSQPIGEARAEVAETLRELDTIQTTLTHAGIPATPELASEQEAWRETQTNLGELEGRNVDLVLELKDSATARQDTGEAVRLMNEGADAREILEPEQAQALRSALKVEAERLINQPGLDLGTFNFAQASTEQLALFVEQGQLKKRQKEEEAQRLAEEKLKQQQQAAPQPAAKESKEAQGERGDVVLETAKNIGMVALVGYALMKVVRGASEAYDHFRVALLGALGPRPRPNRASLKALMAAGLPPEEPGLDRVLVDPAIQEALDRQMESMDTRGVFPQEALPFQSMSPSPGGKKGPLDDDPSELSLRPGDSRKTAAAALAALPTLRNDT